MATRRPDLGWLRDKLIDASSEDPQWDNAADLGRLSMEAMQARVTSFRRTRSSGLLHLTGESIKMHSAPVDTVGALLSDWQKLVTAIGASHRGSRSAYGRLPGDVVSRTRLLLSANPAPGSLILRFAPATSPEDELVDNDGQIAIDQSDTQLIDTAVREAIDLLGAAVALGPSADDSVLIRNLERLGPRTATAVTALAQQIEASGVTSDVVWRQPGRGTARVRFTPSAAGQLVVAVGARDLMNEQIALRGVLETISRRSPLVLRDELTGGMVSVKTGDLQDDVLERFHVGQRVELTADVSYRQRPGGEPQSTYSAQAMRAIG